MAWLQPALLEYQMSVFPAATIAEEDQTPKVKPLYRPWFVPALTRDYHRTCVSWRLHYFRGSSTLRTTGNRRPYIMTPSRFLRCD